MPNFMHLAASPWALGATKVVNFAQFRYFLATLAPSSECIVGSMIAITRTDLAKQTVKTFNPLTVTKLVCLHGKGRDTISLSCSGDLTPCNHPSKNWGKEFFVISSSGSCSCSCCMLGSPRAERSARATSSPFSALVTV